MKKLTASLYALLLAMAIVLGGCSGQNAAETTEEPEVGVNEDSNPPNRRERD